MHMQVATGRNVGNRTLNQNGYVTFIFKSESRYIFRRPEGSPRQFSLDQTERQSERRCVDVIHCINVIHTNRS